MRKHAAALLLILSLGSLSWSAAQGAKTDLFDLKKSRQELEIMKGILNATLGFAANEIQGRDEPTNAYEGALYRYSGMGSNINAFYLYGQGATFIIPISSFRFASTKGRTPTAWLVGPKIATVHDEGMEESLLQLQEEMDALNLEMVAKNEEMAEAAREAAEAAQDLARQAAEYPAAALRGGVAGGVPGGVGGGVVGGVPGGVGVGVGSGKGRGFATGQATSAAPVQAAPSAPAVAPKPAKPQMDKEEMRKKLEDAQAKIRKTREEMEARRKKLIESLTQASGYLVEALANHGDSLTHVRPNEYINIIISTDDEFLVYAQNAEARSRREVISVQKSNITDYKAGRITLDAFKQKVLQYDN
jgi:hypothetical protein